MSFTPDTVGHAPIPLVPPLVAALMRPLPLLPLQFALASLMRRICRRHPDLFDRLGSHAQKRFGVQPTDLPFAFVLAPDPHAPQLRVVAALPDDVDARITAPLAALIGLVEGRLDGDALMFSRDLVVEGDVDAVLALRNAIDDAQLDLAAEAAEPFGPFSGGVARALRQAQAIALGAAYPQGR